MLARRSAQDEDAAYTAAKKERKIMNSIMQIKKMNEE